MLMQCGGHYFNKLNDRWMLVAVRVRYYSLVFRWYKDLFTLGRRFVGFSCPLGS